MIFRARYEWHWHDAARDVCVVIDRLDAKSVTNDAEAVVRDLVELGVPVNDVLVIYRDSMGRWDGLAIAQNQFCGFYALGGQTEADAVRIARKGGVT